MELRPKSAPHSILLVLRASSCKPLSGLSVGLLPCRKSLEQVSSLSSFSPL